MIEDEHEHVNEHVNVHGLNGVNYAAPASCRSTNCKIPPCW